MLLILPHADHLPHLHPCLLAHAGKTKGQVWKSKGFNSISFHMIHWRSHDDSPSHFMFPTSPPDHSRGSPWRRGCWRSWAGWSETNIVQTHFFKNVWDFLGTIYCHSHNRNDDAHVHRVQPKSHVLLEFDTKIKIWRWRPKLLFHLIWRKFALSPPDLAYQVQMGAAPGANPEHT